MAEKTIELHTSEILADAPAGTAARTAVATGWIYSTTMRGCLCETFVPDPDAPHVRKLRGDRLRARKEALRVSRLQYVDCPTCADGYPGTCPDCGSVEVPRDS